MAAESKKIIKAKSLDVEATKPTGASSGVRPVFDTSQVANVLDPNKLRALITSANEGDANDLFTLAEEIEEKDAHYGAILQTRKLGAINYPLAVDLPNEDTKVQEVATEINKLIKTPAFNELLYDLMDAIAKGYSVVEIIWSNQNNKMIPVRYKYCDPRWFKLGVDGYSLDLKTSDSTAEPLARNKFIVHRAMTKSGNVLRSGLIRPISICYICKAFTLTDWMAFLNMFSMPLRIGQYGSGATEEDINTLKQAISRIGTDYGVVISESTQIKIVDTLKDGSASAFENMQNFMNAEMSKRVLGQTMTTENGSSLSQAKIHENTQSEIFLADAKRLLATINEQLIRPFVELNYPNLQEGPQLKIEEKEVIDVGNYIDNVKKAASLGVEISKAEFYEKTGFRLPEKGEDIIAIQATTEQVASFNSNKTEVVASKPIVSKNNLSTSGQDIFIDSTIKAVEELASDSVDIDEMLARFDELFPRVDDEKLTQELATAMFVAGAGGNVASKIKKNRR